MKTSNGLTPSSAKPSSQAGKTFLEELRLPQAGTTIMENSTANSSLGSNTCETRVTGIVVAFNGRKWIDKCLSSLLTNRYLQGVIVVDNGSSDGTCEAAKHHGNRVRVQQIGRNLGFGQANNIGIQQALAADASHVFLLNQDAWIEPNGIDRLMECFEPGAEWGILCPLQLTGDGKKLDRFSFGCLPEALVSDLCLGNTLAKAYPVTFLNAAAWLVSRDAIEATGGFDPLFSMYGEDDDYVRRLSRENFKIGLCPGIRVFHDRAYRVPTRCEARNRAQALATMHLKYSERPLPISAPLFLIQGIRRMVRKAFEFSWPEVLLQYLIMARALGMLSQIQRSRRDLQSRARGVKNNNIPRANDRSAVALTAD